MKKFFGYIALSGLFLLSGCEDYLDQLPDQRTQLDSPSKVSELLVTAYPRGNYITFTEAMSDNVVDNLYGSSLTTPTNANPYFWKDVEELNQDSPTYYWNSCYAAIAAANQALQAIENAPNPEAYSGQKGEALVARAYAHFMLVALFSPAYDPATAANEPGIPYVLEPETVVHKQYERKTVAYVYEQIEKDLTEGLPLLNDNLYTVPAYHFTRRAAHAFATRFYLHKQEPAKVIEHANAAFPSDNFEANIRPWNTTYQAFASTEFAPANTSASESANLLIGETSSWWGRRYRTHQYSMNQAQLNNITAPLGINLNAFRKYSVSSSSYFIIKHQEHFVRTSINATTGVGYNMIPLLTTEEVLLNRAEAYAMLGNYAEALEDMNLYIKTRITPATYNASAHTLTEAKITNYYASKTSDTKQAFIFAVLDLKRAEFVQDGLRWFDLKRHNLPIIHRTQNGEEFILEPGDPRRALQIPQEAMQAGIEQNPR